MTDNIIDFAAARTDRVAQRAVDVSLNAADALVKGLDRFTLLMPDRLSAQAMSIEAVAVASAQVALVAGRSELEVSGDRGKAVRRLLLAISCIKNSIDAYADDVLADLERDCSGGSTGGPGPQAGPGGLAS